MLQNQNKILKFFKNVNAGARAAEFDLLEDICLLTKRNSIVKASQNTSQNALTH